MLGLSLTKSQKPGKCRSKKCKETATWRFPNGDICDIHLAIHKATTNGDYVTPERIRPMASTVSLDDGSIVRKDLRDQQTELQETASDLEETLQMVREYKLENKSDIDFAGESLAEVKRQWLMLENRRKSATKPINSSLKEINSWFKAPQTALRKIEQAWKIKLSESAQEAKERQISLLDEARQAHNSGDTEGTRFAMIQAADAPVEVEGVNFREIWRFEVIDVDKLPRKFMTPDLVKIGAHIKAHKDDSDLPGVRAYKEITVASKTKTL